MCIRDSGKPRGEAAKFIEWVLSKEGQSLVEEVGYYSLNP
jgi:ABC-type phosphate transport system substrate-binding protein